MALNEPTTALKIRPPSQTMSFQMPTKTALMAPLNPSQIKAPPLAARDMSPVNRP